MKSFAIHAVPETVRKWPTMRGPVTRPRSSAGPSQAFRRLTRMLGAVAAGLLVGRAAAGGHFPDLTTISNSPLYAYGIVVLLATGLFASTSGIPLGEIRANIRTIVLAVTLGVAAKAALVGAVMYAAYRSPAYLLLGIAVAQIDPLSVTAMLRFTPMSRQAETILRAWSSFDDPVTVLMTVYLAIPVLRADGSLPRHAPSGILVDGSGWSVYLIGLGANLAFAAVAGAAWFGIRRLRQVGGTWAVDPTRALGVYLLVVLFVTAVRYDLLLGMAVVGLYVRPGIDRFLEKVTAVAYYAAIAMVGLLLYHGTDFAAGVLLGVTAFVGQMAVGYLITGRLPRRDRARIALGQQNGLTAASLGLALQPYFSRAVPIIGVAIIVVNTVYIAANALWGFAAESFRPFVAPAVPAGALAGPAAPAELARPRADLAAGRER